MQQLTDEDRKYLCANLRADAAALTPGFARHNRAAADEIERLEKIVEYLAREVAGPYGIAADVTKAAEEQACSR